MNKMILKVTISGILAFETVFLIKDYIQIHLIIKFAVCTLLAFISYLACLKTMECVELDGFIKDAKVHINEKFHTHFSV